MSLVPERAYGRLRFTLSSTPLSTGYRLLMYLLARWGRLYKAWFTILYGAWSSQIFKFQHAQFRLLGDREKKTKTWIFTVVATIIVVVTVVGSPQNAHV